MFYLRLRNAVAPGQNCEGGFVPIADLIARLKPSRPLEYFEGFIYLPLVEFGLGKIKINLRAARGEQKRLLQHFLGLG